MSESPRAMTLGEIISRSFRVYAKNWKLFLGLALAPVLAQLLIYLSVALWLYIHPIPRQSISTTLTFEYQLTAKAEDFICSLFYYVFYPCYFIAINLMFAGEKPLLRNVLRYGFRRFGSISGFTLINVILCTALPAVPLLLFVKWVTLFTNYQFAPGIAHSAGTSLIWMAIFLEWLLAAWLSISFDLGIIALVQERLKPFAALKRSWTLVSEARVRLALIYLFVLVAVFIIALVNEVILAAFISIFLKHSAWAAPLQVIKIILRRLIDLPVYLFLAPIWPVVLSLVYYDQRIRQEAVSFPALLNDSLRNMFPEHAVVSVSMEEGAAPTT